MIGAGMIQAASSSIIANYNVVVAPSLIEQDTPNGSYVSPTINATVYNGVGPFTYEWVYADPTFGGLLFGADTSQCTAQFAAINERIFQPVVCTVTDTGNANAEVTDFCVFDITFE